MVNRFSIIANAFAVASLTLGTVFTVAPPAQAQRIVTCESNNYDRQSCLVNTRGGVRLYRQLSRGRCNGNWGYNRNRIWVRHGCRAQFVVGNPRDDRYYRRDRDDRYYRRDRDDRYYRRDRDDRYYRRDRDDRYYRY
jgi:Protein of unknown function (DUF3011)